MEIQGVRQRPEEGFRRWFSNNYFDIVIWYEEEGGEISGIQFCYGKPFSEKAFTWESTSQSHHYVTEQRKSASATGMLKGDAGIISESVMKQLKEESHEMDKDLLVLVLEKIDAFNLRS